MAPRGRKIVGSRRISLNLLERKNVDATTPFALMMTYFNTLKKHIPLYRLTMPKSREMVRKTMARIKQSSDFMADLLSDDDPFKPKPLTAEQAYRFLKDAENIEKAGVTVRVPDWWNQKRKLKRPVVTVSIGKTGKSEVGAESMMSFSASLTLDGKTLSESEKKKLFGKAGIGLMSIKGSWVEVNPDMLREILDKWDGTPNQIGLGEANRILAGVDGRVESSEDETGEPKEEEEDGSQLEKVSIGDWLKDQMDAIRKAPPAAEEAAAAGSESYFEALSSLRCWLAYEYA